MFLAIVRLNCPAKSRSDMMKSDFKLQGPKYRFSDDSDIRIQGDFCICLCGNISDILSH